MIAAAVADVDGIGIVAGEEMYWRLHHVVGHNLLFGVVIAIVLTVFSVHRVKAFALYLGLFHLHLFMDYWGSGPGWAIFYLWPFSNWAWKNPQSWELTSWQNTTTAAILLVWMIMIAAWRRRTPLELITPRLDRSFVIGVRRTLGMRDPAFAKSSDKETSLESPAQRQ